jgi:hypothetical protein
VTIIQFGNVTFGVASHKIRYLVRVDKNQDFKFFFNYGGKTSYTLYMLRYFPAKIKKTFFLNKFFAIKRGCALWEKKMQFL